MGSVPSPNNIRWNLHNKNTFFSAMTLNWSNRNEGNSSGSVSGLVSEGGGGGSGFVGIECLSDGYIIDGWMDEWQGL